MTRSGRVVIASTRAATGVYEDRCGPIIVDWLIQRGIATPVPTVVADGTEVNHALFAAIGENVDVVITSGGTGISPTDRTADATANIVDYQIPGLADAIRRDPSHSVGRVLARAADTGRRGRSAGRWNPPPGSFAIRWSASRRSCPGFQSRMPRPRSSGCLMAFARSMTLKA
jgi:molybdenum cofactor synthesis domain-containing protein